MKGIFLILPGDGLRFRFLGFRFSLSEVRHANSAKEETKREEREITYRQIQPFDSQKKTYF